MRKLILLTAICLLCACGGDGHNSRSGATDPTTPVDPPVDTPEEPPAAEPTALETLGLRKPALPRPPLDASALRAPQA